MKVASLFSGCGGLDLGLIQAGHEIVLQCENDPAARQVLKDRFPGVLLVPDICGLKALPAGVDLVSAGFPCIDISRAGLQEGIGGQSTGLVRHVFRLLGIAQRKGRPVPFVLLENVEALLHRVNGEPPAVAAVVAALEDLGYMSWAQRVISSAGFGVPNRRRRVFILAAMYTDARDMLLVQGEQPCVGACVAEGPPQAPPGLVARARRACTLPPPCEPPGRCYECFLADGDDDDASQHTLALDLGNGRSAPAVDVVPTFTTCNGRMCLLTRRNQLGCLRITDAERLQGFAPGFTKAAFPVKEPGSDAAVASQQGNSSGAGDRVRFGLLGNAVTVQVAAWLGGCLASPFRFKYIRSNREYPMASSLPGVPVLWEKTPAEQAASTATQAAAGADATQAWPHTAWFVRGLGRFGVSSVSDVPVKVPFRPLSTFVTEVGPLPPAGMLTSFIHRLRENGFNVTPLVQRAVACGAQLDASLTQGVAGLKKRKVLTAEAPDANALALAAERAGAEPACGVCEACQRAVTEAPRRCLLVRARAAAASGHGGAQFAVLGDAAVSRRVRVWWPLDQAWYSGTITKYDKQAVRHTVVYDDGDVETVPLWQSNQLVHGAPAKR